MSKVAAESAGQDVLARLEKAEQELAALRRELDHSQQLATLGTLTAGIAHEINNILTPVLAYAQLSRANPGDTALRNKALDRAIAGVESAGRIVEAVLGFAREGEDEEHSSVLDVVESTLACLGRDLSRDAIDLCIDVDSDAFVRIRPLALQQVLLNLILNSITALDGKPGAIRISTARLDGAVEIAVADTGPGVPPDVSEKMFDPFVTSRPRNQRKDPTQIVHGGSGLGLAVCKRLIERGGGKIGLDPDSVVPRPTPGHGATFRITLPSLTSDDNRSGKQQKAA